MSYDFALWNGDEPLEQEEAKVIYQELVARGQSEQVKPTPSIKLLLAELKKLYPLKRRKEDDWPFAAPHESGPGYVIVHVSQSFLNEVWPVVGGLSGEYGLT